MSVLTEFALSVHESVRRIPPGETRTYGQVARSIGKDKAHRAVARVLRTNPYSFRAMSEGRCTKAQMTPCHRVVNAKGNHIGYLGDTSDSACSFCASLIASERDVNRDNALK